MLAISACRRLGDFLLGSFSLSSGASGIWVFLRGDPASLGYLDVEDSFCQWLLSNLWAAIFSVSFGMQSDFCGRCGCSVFARGELPLLTAPVSFIDGPGTDAGICGHGTVGYSRPCIFEVSGVIFSTFARLAGGCNPHFALCTLGCAGQDDGAVVSCPPLLDGGIHFGLPSYNTILSACRRRGFQRTAFAVHQTRLDRWLVWLDEHASGFLLSFLALVTAALMRLLFFGTPLRGGDFNVDPAIRCGRGCLRGASFALLVFGCMASPALAGPSQPANAMAAPSCLGAVSRMRSFDLAQQLSRRPGDDGVRVVQSAGPVLHLPFSAEGPEGDLGPPEDEDEWRQFTVRVFMFGKADQIVSVWLRIGCSEHDALEAIAGILLIDRAELRISAIRPQPPDDTLDVAITPVWWEDSGLRFFCLDGSEANRPTYLCTVPANCTFDELKCAAGPHLLDGLDIFQGNATAAVPRGDLVSVQDADLFRLRYCGRMRVMLPTMDEALADAYWARNIEVDGLPSAAPPDGRVLVLGGGRRFIYRVSSPIPHVELHRRLARLAASSMEEQAFFLPRSDFDSPSYRGTPVEYIVALCPRSMYPATDTWTGVFVDARDLGRTFDFQLHPDDELLPADVADGLGFTPPEGMELYFDGYDRVVPGTGRYKCIVGACLAIWVDAPGQLFRAPPFEVPDEDSGNLDNEDDGDGAGLHESPRSRSPRRRIRPRPRFPPRGRGGRRDAHASRGVHLHASVFMLQRATQVITLSLHGQCDPAFLKGAFRERAFPEDAEREIIPLRPQFADSCLGFLATAPWCYEAGLFPCLLDASWYGIPPFLFMAGPSISFEEAVNVLGNDWPQDASLYVLGAGRLREDDDPLFVHMGMALVLRPVGHPPNFVNFEDKLETLCLARAAGTAHARRRQEVVAGSVACLGPANEDFVVHCPPGRDQELPHRVSLASGMDVGTFRTVSMSRPLREFCCKGIQVEAVVGVQPLTEEFCSGVFLDVRDLGYEVGFLCLHGPSMFLSDILHAASVRRPPGRVLKVVGAVLYTPSTELVTFGHRTVISVLVDGPPLGDPAALPLRADQGINHDGSTDDSDELPFAYPDLEEIENVQGPSGSSSSSGMGGTVDFEGGRRANMWKLAHSIDVLAEHKPKDTSVMCDELVTVMDAAIVNCRGAIDAFVNKVIAALWRSDPFYDCADEASHASPLGESLGSGSAIVLDELLPVCDSGKSGLHPTEASDTDGRHFRLDFGQCRLPLTEGMLADVCAPKPFSQLRAPPANLSRPERFRDWVAQGACRSLLPGEDLLVTCDGSFHPDSGSAGWGIVFSAGFGPCSAEPGVFLGCCWGSLTALRSSLGDRMDAVDAYTSEVVGLLWGALAVLQLRFTGDVRFRCDCLSALHGAAGLCSLRDGVLSSSMRSLHIAVMRARNSTPQYQHIPGHAGYPDNELADALAEIGASQRGNCGPFSVDLAAWLAAGSTSFDWLPHAIWQARDASLFPGLHDGVLSWDRHRHHAVGDVQSILGPFLPVSVSNDASCGQTGRLHCSFATYNCLSILDGGEHRTSRDQPLLEVGRPSLLASCLDGASVGFAGIQEARTPAGMLRTGRYVRFCSGADSSSNYGVELWVHLDRPFATFGGKQHWCNPRDFVVQSSEPTFLIVRMMHAMLDVMFLVGHAPHRARPPADREAWWRKVHAACKSVDVGGPWVVLIDANARLGSCPTVHVGAHHRDEQDCSGGWFHLLLEALRLYLPSTFRQSMWGPGETLYVRRNASWARSDYVALPLEWGDHQVWSWVDPQISAGHACMDHLALLCSANVELTSLAPPAAKRKGPIDAAALRDPKNADAVCDILYSAPEIEWQVNVHVHGAMVADYLYKELAAAFPATSKKMRSDFFSDNTKHLHTSLRHVQGRLRHRNWALRCTRLRCAFLVWASCRPGAKYVGGYFDVFQGKWLADLFVNSAVDISRICGLAALLRRSCRGDRNDYVSRLADEVNGANADEIFRACQKLVNPRRRRRDRVQPLPRLRDKSGNLCADKQAVMDCWREHFSVIEAGREVSAEELIGACNAASAGGLGPEFIGAAELPSLREFENAVRAIAPRKAAGLDGIPPDVCHFYSSQVCVLLWPLLLKVLCLAQEPLGYKGGVMHHISKPGGCAERCSGSRGILVQGCLAKAIQKATRGICMQKVNMVAHDLHIGGRKGYTALFGSMLARCVLRFARHVGRSAGIIFVDLASAYYSVLREVVVGTRSGDCDFDTLIATLGLEQEDVQALTHAIQTDPVLGEMDSELLTGLARDFHAHTWFLLHNDSTLVETRKGSRPGSSWADSFFALCFMIMGRREASFLHAAPPRFPWDGRRCFGPPPEPGDVTRQVGASDVVFADDLALFVIADAAEQLGPAISEATGSVVDAFRTHGFRENVGKAKTAALAVPSGRGCRQARKQLFDDQKGKLTVMLEHSGHIQIDLVPAYKHLGTLVNYRASLDGEVGRRLALARAAFREGKKKLYANKRIAVARRAVLFQSNILGILLYGAGSWGILSAGATRTFFGGVQSLYRQLLAVKTTDDQAWTRAQIQAAVGLPSPQVLLHGARLRFLVNLVRQGPEALWAGLRYDQDFVKAVVAACQWLHGLLRATIALPDPALDMDPWLQFIAHSPKRWKGMIRRATSVDQCRQEAQSIVDGAVRRVWRQDSGEELAAEGLNEACLQCRLRFSSRQAWAAHAARSHGYRARHTHAGHGRTCLACGSRFATEGRLRKHLAWSSRCLEYVEGCQAPEPASHRAAISRLQLLGVSAMLGAGFLMHPARPNSVWLQP